MPYAYRPLHDEQLPHAFLNTVLFLDHRRQGFPWPVVCMPINCYGRKVVSAQGRWRPFGDELDLDPPSPPPWRLMDVGSAVAGALRRSPWRVAVIASSSWSHAFLTDHTWRLRPDTAADGQLYEAMIAGDFSRWEKTTTADIEHAGQHEVLNWFALQGAARQLGVQPSSWTTFVETWVLQLQQGVRRLGVARGLGLSGRSPRPPWWWRRGGRPPPARRRRRPAGPAAAGGCRRRRGVRRGSERT